MKQKAFFLDRDGVLILDKHFVGDPKNVEIIPGVRDFLQWAIAENYHLFLFTNQSGVGRGYFTMQDVHACNNKMLELLDMPHSTFKETCIAPEGPYEPSLYRKPSPRFILEMIEKFSLEPKHCYMFGDTVTDLQAGLQAGINSVWVKTGHDLTAELKTYIDQHQLPSIPNLITFPELLKKQKDSLSLPI